MIFPSELRFCAKQHVFDKVIKGRHLRSASIGAEWSPKSLSHTRHDTQTENDHLLCAAIYRIFHMACADPVETEAIAATVLTLIMSVASGELR